MKRLLIFIGILFIVTGELFGQITPAFQSLGDASGINLETLNLQEASAILRKIVQDSVNDNFTVFDIGMYPLIDRYNDSYDYEDAFEEARKKAKSLSRYYVLFAREHNTQQINNNFKVHVELPDTGIYICIKPIERKILNASMTTLLRERYSQSNDIVMAEKFVIDSFTRKLIDIFECGCIGRSSMCNICPNDQELGVLLKEQNNQFLKIATGESYTNSSSSEGVYDFSRMSILFEGQSVNLNDELLNFEDELVQNDIKIIILNSRHYCDGNDSLALGEEIYKESKNALSINVVSDGIFWKTKSISLEVKENIARILTSILAKSKYSTRFYFENSSDPVTYYHGGLQNAICIVKKENAGQFWIENGKIPNRQSFRLADSDVVKLRSVGITYGEKEMNILSNTYHKSDDFDPANCLCENKDESSKCLFYKVYVPKNAENPDKWKKSNFFTEVGSYFDKVDNVYILNLGSKQVGGLTIIHREHEELPQFHTHPNRIPWGFDLMAKWYKKENCKGALFSVTQEGSTQSFVEAEAGASTKDLYIARGDGNVSDFWWVVHEEGVGYFFYNKYTSGRGIFVPRRNFIK